MNPIKSMSRAALATLPAILLMAGAANAAPPPLPHNLQASLFTTLPSTSAHSPEMALDGNLKSYFQSVYQMRDTDVFLVMLSSPVPVRSLHIVTGDADGKNGVTAGKIETSADGVTFSKVASFDATGAASATLGGAVIKAIRIKLDPNTSVPSMLIREITINSPAKIKGVHLGSGQGFVDYSEAPDLADWAKRAEAGMEAFWPITADILHSDGFITPNMVTVIYHAEDGVAGTDAGVMTISTNWAHAHDDDAGLAVHEMTHVIQATPYEPVWMVEGIADYIRWVKFEPQHFHPRINVEKSKYTDSYQTTATFLGWCENHYDAKIVTQMNDAVRYGKYNTGLWKQFTGKDVDTLWAEFIADYKADPAKILAKPGA